MSPETYAALKDAVAPIMEAKAICQGGEINERWRWDALWRSGFSLEGLDDDHISTVLKRIVRELQR